MDPINELQLLVKIIAAGLLAGIVGLEREAAQKPAGLRTHMLVRTTAALLTGMAIRAVDYFGGAAYLRTDPIRIIEAIVVGISFLGAGTILKHAREDDSVEGLTTSASILSVAAIGVTIALDAYLVAVGVTAWNLFINWGLNRLANAFREKPK